MQLVSAREKSSTTENIDLWIKCGDYFDVIYKTIHVDATSNKILRIK